LSRPEIEEDLAVLVELALVEQRHKAVLEVLEGGLSVVEVARRFGVVRQTVHEWLRDYARDGIMGLADKSSKPATCPHQMGPEVEALVVGWRREHPSWGPQTLLYELGRAGVDPLPGRTSIYRALIRHGLIDPKQRRRRRSDYKRWERSRAMERWQKDITGGVHLADGSQASVVTGVDDNSRFCVCAKVVRRATARPVCDAFAEAMRRHGVPDGVLTDNGKVFTGKYGPGTGEVLFDRICRENGIRHLLTAPRSPTTTGKIERFHKTLKAECLTGRVFATLEEAQAAIDEWVEHYNTRRPHQGIGNVPPIERFRFARPELAVVEPQPEPACSGGDAVVAVTGLRGVTRWVDQAGRIGLGGFRYHVGRFLSGELVEVICRNGLVEISRQGVIVATHAQRRPPGAPRAERPSPGLRRKRTATIGKPVRRIVDNGGTVSFAGTNYRVGRVWRRRTAEVAIVADSVQVSVDGRVVRVHPVRHDRAKEHGAFANPKGRPRKPRTVAKEPELPVAQVPELNCRPGTGT
jgi:transposase InsO family protein